MRSQLSLSWAVLSDPGLRRTSNEDCHTVRPDIGLFGVAINAGFAYAVIAGILGLLNL